MKGEKGGSRELIMDSKNLGKIGEDMAIDFLRGQGYRIIERNCRTRYGEIDIVARERNCLVFVEVRARGTLRFGGPLSSITPGKRRRLTGIALSLLQKRRFRGMPARFDVLGIEFPEGAPPRFHLIKNAFEPESC